MEELDKNFVSGQILNASDMNQIVGKVNEVIREVNEQIPEAPQDGKTYGRNNGQWAEILGGEGGSITIDSELSETSTNPVQNKITTEAIIGLLSKDLSAKLYQSQNGIGYEDMISGKYYNTEGTLNNSASFFACKIDMGLLAGGVLHFKNLNNSKSALCSWVKSDGSIVNLRIIEEQDVIVPDDVKYLLVTNNNIKEEYLITYNGVIDNKIKRLDYKSNGFYFSNDNMINGNYNSEGRYNSSTSFKCLKIDVSSLKGESLKVNLLTNGAAPCSWVKDNLSIEPFQVKSEQDITIPDDALYFLANNQQTNIGGYIKFQTKTQNDVEYIKNNDSNIKPFTFFGEQEFHVGYYDVSGKQQSSVSFVCLKIDVRKYIGKNVYIRLSTNLKAPCSWLKSDGTIENFQVTDRTITSIPDDSEFLLCNNNKEGLSNGYYVFIEPNTISKYANSLWGLTNYCGKKLTTYGDSITNFGGWQDIIVNTLGLSTHVNCGKAGSTICLNGTTYMSLCDDARISALPVDTDILLIMGGTNDFSSNKEIGEQKYDNEDGNTFFGALNIIAKKVITQCPKAKIFYMSIYAGRYTYIDGWSEDMMVNTAGCTIYDYRDAIKKCAYMHGFPFIDIIGNMGANRYNAEKYFGKDGAYSHPNAYGKEEMAKIIISKLLSL